MSEVDGASVPTRMQEIAQELLVHYRDNPTHGAGCSCVDHYMGELRTEFRITKYWLHEEDEATQKAGGAMLGILHSVANTMYRYQMSKHPETEDEWPGES